MHGKMRSCRKGVVPIIAVAVMVAVALLTTGIFSAEINRVFSSPAPEEITVQELVLMKHYGYAYFKITIQSNCDRTLKLNVSLIGEDGAAAATIQDISLAPRGSVTVDTSGMFGYRFFVGNSYAVKVWGDLGVSYLVECKGVEFSRNKLILLTIEGFSDSLESSGVTNSSALLAGAEDTAIRLGIPYEKVTTISRWNSILSNPPRGVVVINPFGGVTPVPTAAVDSPESFIRNLSYVVGNYSWTWVHVAGEPFFILSDGKKSTQLNSDLGIQWFFNTSQVTVAHSNAPEELQECVLTDTHGNSLRYFLTVTSFRDLPETMKFGYPMVLPPSDYPTTKFIFYEKDTTANQVQSAATSFCIGSGYYVYWGGPSDKFNEYETGGLSLMLALYTNLR
ncbi:MAG: hypothetical protein H5T32_07110 [Candidatus Methanosuratus sp.]|nr:hypothetical protein [Candidatus Methanosuratincola sp.]